MIELYKMSSKVSRKDRTIKKDYPDRIKKIFNAILDNVGPFRLYGSYNKMTFEIDSDIDVAIKDIVLSPVVKNIGKHFNIKIDVIPLLDRMTGKLIEKKYEL